jgi:hypothetical protein
LLWANEITTLKTVTPWSLGVLDQFVVVRIVKDTDAIEMFEQEEVWPRMSQ